MNKILEEAEIYAPDLDHVDVWGFVEKYYPTYYSCNEIMRNDDLCKIVNQELNGDAVKLFRTEFNNDHNLVVIAFDQSNKYIYERAIIGYLQSQNNTIATVWRQEDVEHKAKDNGFMVNKSS